MRIITRAVLDWNGNILEQDSYEYTGPLEQAKSSGSAPQPVDPYTQAGAQYGLATGTANYNAALNRTGEVNPLGSSSWSVTGNDSGTPTGGQNLGGGLYGFGGRGGMSGPGATIPGATGGMNGGSGAPLYTQQTSLTPWANQMLSSPIDTSGLAGMPGGPNISQDLQNTQLANYNQQMGYLQPQEAQQTDSQNAQLAAEGATRGSEAWNNAQGNLGRQQTFANQQAVNSAIGAGNQEQATLFGLGSQGLQNQLAVRNAPISEFNQLSGNGGAQVNAATPDISGAFGQQYQGQLAGYNANNATNNANDQAAASAAMMALMMSLSSSDRRVKDDIKKVGEMDSGEPIFTFRYKGQPKIQMGVMAQDIEKTKPDAVVELGGVKHVNYGAL